MYINCMFLRVSKAMATRYTGSFMLMVLLMLCGAAYGTIIFEGPVPADVSKGFIESEYTRIYAKIAPFQRPSRAPLHIVFYSSHNHAERFSLPEWGGGGAIGDSLIIIPVDVKPFLKQNFSQTTVHELVHSIINRAYPGVAVPRWFHEGLAMTLSGEVSYEEQSSISLAILTNRLLPLAAIDSVNGFSRSRADIAYSESHIAILYIIETCGFKAPFTMLTIAYRTHSFNLGLQDVTGLSEEEFEGQLRQNIIKKYRFLFFVADSTLWWVCISLLVIIGFFITMRRNTKRALAIEAEERRELARQAEAETEAEADTQTKEQPQEPL